MSDSSAKGYAVHATNITASEVKPLIAAPERARFVAHEDSPGPDDVPFLGALPGPRLPVDDIFDTIPRRPQRRGPRRPRVLIRTGFILDPLPDVFVAADRWARVARGAWRCPGKIHALEARATLYGLKKASAEIVTHGWIVFSVGDNLSSILAYEKGRARCEDLLAQCRQAAGRRLRRRRADRWHHRHVESERNVTDHDSRAADRAEVLRGQAPSTARSNRFSASSTREAVAPLFIAPNGNHWPLRRRRPSPR